MTTWRRRYRRHRRPTARPTADARTSADLPPRLAKQNGATEDELIEAITQLAIYAGWPKAAITVAKRILPQN
jgi:hypothetical protein